MKFIVQANIDHLNGLLKNETDPTKRVAIKRILAEEEKKLANLAKPENKQA